MILSIVFLYLNSKAQSTVNFPADSLIGKSKIETDSAVQSVNKEKAVLHKNDLPRPEDTSLIISRTVAGSPSNDINSNAYTKDNNYVLYGTIFICVAITLLILWIYKRDQKNKRDAN